MPSPSAPLEVKRQAELAEVLADQIRRHRDLYYNGQPEITDEEFDALEDRLRQLAPSHPVLGEVGAPAPAEVEPQAGSLSAELLETVFPLSEQLSRASDRYYEGDELISKKDYEKLWLELRELAPGHPVFERVVPPTRADWPKARHDIPMGSLNKVNSVEELAQWATRCDQLAVASELSPISSDLAMTEKLDGISIELVYSDGRVEAAITRGDGVVGERITPNAMRMQGVPETIAHRARVSVRGEVLLKKSDAAAFAEAKKRVDKDFSGELSLRNSAAGQARAKDPKFLPMCRHLSILFYDVEGIESVQQESDKIEFLHAQGFSTPRVQFGQLDTIEKEYDAYRAGGRDELDYDIDGLVVRANAVRSFDLLGELNNRPRAAIAFKFPSDMKVSTLVEIRWETGPSGRITPVAIVEPVRLAGANVERASLHNMANVERLGIGAGDQVLVSRRGDVIPYVEKVEIKGPNEESIPDRCSVCDAEVTVEGEYLVCRNPSCAARKVGRLKVWIRQLGLLEWGEKTLERLYEAGLAEEPADLYRLRREDIASLEGYGEVTAKKLLEPLNANKEIPIATFIAALGIETVSLETTRLLVSNGYDTVEGIAAASVEELAALEGLGAIKAEKIAEGMRARLDEVRRLAEVGVVPVAPREGGPLAGLSFCFSGAASRPRKVLQQLVEDNGGLVANGVKKGLSYLVLEDASSTSSKAQKARKLGTEIIDEATFDQMIIERGGKLD